MNNDFANTFQYQDLRERAAAELSGKPDDCESTKFTPWSAHLIHELQTHQIELELQNETLRQTHDKLIESHERYSNLYDFAPVGYLTIDQPCQIVEANLVAADLLQVERGTLVGSWLRRFVVPEHQDTFYLNFQREVITMGDRQSIDLRLLKADESSFAARLHIATIPHGDGIQRLIAISDLSSPATKS